MVRILPPKEVLKITGMSRTTLWRAVKAGKFPAKAQISENRVGFFEDEVANWVEIKRQSRVARDLPVGAKSIGERI